MDKNPTKIERQPLNADAQKAVDDENMARSLRRTQREISDIVDCNPFEWFGTFTFAPDKVENRYDDAEIYSKMSKWLNNQRRQSPDFVYLLVPERHKDGALHFHALIGCFKAPVVDSGKKWQKQPIFNIPSYTHGFTNFTRIRDKAKTANYCRKYITKDLMTEKNRRRYWGSKNLAKPERVENLELSQLFTRYDIDMQAASDEYENDYVIQHTLPLTGRDS